MQLCLSRVPRVPVPFPSQGYAMLDRAFHATEDLVSSDANTIGDCTGALLQQNSLYNGTGRNFDIRPDDVNICVYSLPLGTGISTGYYGLNGSVLSNQSPNVLELNGFNNSSAINQSGMGQPVSWDPTNPGDGSDIANYHNNGLATGLSIPPMVNNASGGTSAPHFATLSGDGFTTGNNSLGGNPGFSEYPSHAPACLFVPCTHIAASDNLGWPMDGNVASALTTPPAINEGRPMTDIPPVMQPHTGALLSQTGSTPFRLRPVSLSKRRQKGGVPCPEGCGTILSRRYDIPRHLAQKHTVATLRCPVRGCIKQFSRRDKRSDHLKNGHKLGAEDINMLFAANLGEGV
ncbi:hypothetical protein BCR34DRAFT_265643 [Clohesyomyces aquaticus]|uniref:C2H2-type domain-containing protein n=1 Tax=Clohesyomyces aquaticus TaxID=1231657 RepID=A0A1Y1ZUS4_9PLEO|nr:hypothetical protein BCR34DRAFT_265643 [Clohesyomyces aquaticus]